MDIEFAALYAGRHRETREDDEEYEEEEKKVIGRRLVVKGLPSSMDKEGMREMLLKYGQVTRLEVSKARRGWCAVDFAERSDASSALLALDGSIFKGREIKAEMAKLFTTRKLVVADVVAESEEASEVMSFAGRGTRSARERDKIIDQRYRSEKVAMCEYCGGPHFGQGCVLADRNFLERLARNEVSDFLKEVNPPRSLHDDVIEPSVVTIGDSLVPPQPTPLLTTTPIGRGRGVTLPSWWKKAEHGNIDKEAYMHQHNQQSLPREYQENVQIETETEEHQTNPLNRRREQRRAKVKEDATQAIDQWRHIVSNYVVWPTSDAGIFLKFDFDTTTLFYCRALPGGKVLHVDCTPSKEDGRPRNLTRQIERLRLDVAADANAATLEVLSLAAERARYSFLDIEYNDLAALRDVLLEQPYDISLPDSTLACWSPPHCAYYFHDSLTSLVSWVLPQQQTNSNHRPESRRKENRFHSRGTTRTRSRSPPASHRRPKNPRRDHDQHSRPRDPQSSSHTYQRSSHADAFTRKGSSGFDRLSSHDFRNHSDSRRRHYDDNKSSSFSVSQHQRPPPTKLARRG